jgi:hypothetical protein
MERPVSRLDRLAPLSGILFLVLIAVGNAMQGSTPALHGDADAVADFYGDKATRIAVGMSLSLLGLFFLAWFLGSLRERLLAGEGRDGHLAAIVVGAGFAAIALMAAGFALTAAGALRAQEAGAIPADQAAVFYDGGLALTGLAAPIAMAVLLAATAGGALRFGALPRWFGWLSIVLAVLGIITPLSFLLFLAFPLWVLLASILLYRHQRTDEVPRRP